MVVLNNNVVFLIHRLAWTRAGAAKTLLETLLSSREASACYNELSYSDALRHRYLEKWLHKDRIHKVTMEAGSRLSGRPEGTSEGRAARPWKKK